MKRFVVAAACLLISKLLAQQPTIRHYSLADGLPSNEVYEVRQDHNNFLWICTDNGVVKYDGTDFKTLSTGEGMADPVVFNSITDDKGRTWFKSYSGRLTFDEGGQLRPFDHNEVLAKLVSNDILSHIYFVGGRLHFSTGRVIGAIDSTGNYVIEQIPLKEFRIKSIGNQILYGANGITGKINTVNYNGVRHAVQLTDTVTNNSLVRLIHWRNTVLIGINNDIFSVSSSSLKRVFTGPAPIIGFNIDRSDNLWVGYNKAGVHRFEGLEFTPSSLGIDLKGLSVTSVEQDHEGGYWFSTLESGVFYMANPRLHNVPMTFDTKVKSVLNVDDAIVIAAQDGSIVAYDNRSHQVRWSNRVNPTLYFLTQNPITHALWLSNNGSTQLLDSTWKPIRTHSPLSIIHAASDKFGNIWSVGSTRILKTSRSGLITWQIKTDTLHRFVYPHDTLVFLAGRTGLYARSQSGKILFSVPALKNVKVTHISSLSKTKLLVSTVGLGFVIFDTIELSSREFNTKNSFISDYVYVSIVTDSLVCMATDKGLAFLKWSDINESRVNLKLISDEGGLDSKKINFLASGHNEIWAFGDNSFCIIPLDATIRFASERPIFYLKELLVNGARNVKDHQILRHSENNVRIDFGFISFNNSVIFLRHRTAASDPWTYSQDRSLDFYSLAPGTYQFQLEYSTDNFHWTSAPQFPTITISPPWWQTWYFTATVVIVVLSFSAFYFRARMKVANERQRFLEANAHHQEALLQAEIESIEKERSRIAKDLHDGIGASVLALKLMVYEKLSQYADPELPEINLHFNELMSELKLIIHNLEPPGLDNHSLQEGLNEYVYRINAALKTRIQFSANGQPIQDPKVNTLMFRIVQELIANTLKHSDTKKAEIKISKSTEQVVLDYRDDGRINIETRGRNGHGLLNIEARVKAMNGKLTIVGDEGFLCRVEIPLPNTLH